MTKFNHCPNCKKSVAGGFFGAAYKIIYECKQSRTLYCYKCGDKRCPNCGSESRREAGKAYAP